MNEIVTKDFELNAQIVAGTLTSNAKEFKANIENELKNYTVDRYVDTPDVAKKDKAFLNKVKDTVQNKRKEVTELWNKPLEDFIDEMKSLEKEITKASDDLNGIVKEAENKVKDEKRKQIEDYWKSLDVKIVTLDKIFNPKWLNKTVKLDAVILDIENIIEKITTELDTLKSMADEDSETLMSFYLETLDLNATLQKGNELKANRKKLAALQAEKTVEVVTKVFNGTVVGRPAKTESEVVNTSSNTAEEKKYTFTLRITDTTSKLWALRKFLDDNNIKYEKV